MNLERKCRTCHKEVHDTYLELREIVHQDHGALLAESDVMLFCDRECLTEFLNDFRGYDIY